MRPLPHPSAKPYRVVATPLHSLIAQSVERRTVNPQVPGSSPGRGANNFWFNFLDLVCDMRTFKSPFGWLFAFLGIGIRIVRGSVLKLKKLYRADR